MDPPRRNHGNEARSYWRQQCREKLSFYLLNELGIVVNPNEIRLKPRPDDPYRWRLSPSKQSLFKNQLSKQGTRGCKEIFRSVGETITAVSASVVGDGSEMEASEVEQTILSGISTVCQPGNHDGNRLDSPKESLAHLLYESEKQVETMEKQLENSQSIIESLRKENILMQYKLEQTATTATRALSEMAIINTNMQYDATGFWQPGSMHSFTHPNSPMFRAKQSWDKDSSKCKMVDSIEPEVDDGIRSSFRSILVCTVAPEMSFMTSSHVDFLEIRAQSGKEGKKPPTHK
ncbi:uncharacterized protein TRUGW13939_07636 [Talaromyces rugulosus]|uniref:Uncharacterized protein n=1 Tax=Talaromyces rugulosus TaxID=121627 RepID=A0A7H8R480_TALRU|nr:uncharacterized protein TRUGW13939_07636 [Talaromyces rugulosus]QKX60491.1 hypothetical protein TRUGW13939_07636 [Talaromyces rugulosus]